MDYGKCRGCLLSFWGQQDTWPQPPTRSVGRTLFPCSASHWLVLQWPGSYSSANCPKVQPLFSSASLDPGGYSSTTLGV